MQSHLVGQLLNLNLSLYLLFPNLLTVDPKDGSQAWSMKWEKSMLPQLLGKNPD